MRFKYSKAVLSFLLLTIGICCSVGTLFLQDKAVSVALVICSLFVFAQGWDWLKDILNSAEIFGRITWPTLTFPVKRDLKVELLNAKGVVCAYTSLEVQNDFKFSFVTPGAWTVRFTGSWTTTIDKQVEVQRWQKSDIGTILISFNLGRVWQREHVPNIGQIVDVELLPDKTIWAVGFKTLPKCHNIRITMCKKANEPWKEVIIPQLSTAERACFVRSLSENCLVVGSLGAGGAFSIDHGKTWKKITLPTEIDSFTWAVELPDKTIVACGWEWRHGLAKNAVVLKYLNGLDSEPKITKSIDGSEFTAALLTESGRLLIGERSYKNGGGIIFSEDFGESWLNTNITSNSISLNDHRFLGISSFVELPDSILAGTFSGRGFKTNGLIIGGSILLSNLNPTDWKIIKHDVNLDTIKGICTPNKNTVIFLSTISSHHAACKLYISSNNGISWCEFIEAFGASPLSKLACHGDNCIVFGMNSIAIASSADLVFDRFS